MIPLQSDGDGRSRSLTRVVLPIHVRLTAEDPREEGGDTPEPDGWHYRVQEPEEMEDIWARSAYFTVDTSYVLFRRAKWLKLEPRDQSEARKEKKVERPWSSFSYSAPPLAGGANQERTINVEIAPPRVVLFEEADELVPQEKPKKESCGLPKTGFLILDFRLMPSKLEPPKDEGKESEGKKAVYESIYLEDMLAFNDQVRCLWSLSDFENFKYTVLMGRCRQLHGPEEKFDGSMVAKWQQAKLEDLRRKCPGKQGAGPLSVSHLRLWESALLNPVRKGKKEIWLIDNKLQKNARRWARGCADKASCAGKLDGAVPGRPPEEMSDHTGWLATTDYRAYLWTSAFLHKEHSLSSHFYLRGDRPEQFGHWVKFLNVDASGDGYWNASHTRYSAELAVNDTSSFEQDWARDHTYARWARYGSYYGFTPHSGALLSTFSVAECDVKLKKPYHIGDHFQTMHFDQVLLLLYLRICAFDFSLHLAQIGAKLRDRLHEPKKHWWSLRPNVGKVIEEQRKPYGIARREFMSFASLYQFPLLSTQQQGVEMYTLARKQMDVDDLFKDIANEIDSADRVMATHNEETVSGRIGWLTLWGLPVAITGLIVAGIELLKDEYFIKWTPQQLIHGDLWPFHRWRSGAIDAGVILLLFLFLRGVLWLIDINRSRRR